ncbi:MAG: hypothetical protein J5I50_08830 [Chitinophagaceae bacterium]|nr:hypothetical protein [Chitinophagaceae bacterium]
MVKRFSFLYAFLLCLVWIQASAQERNDSLMLTSEDTLIVPVTNSAVIDTITTKDTVSQKVFVPRKATIRSAIIPGWGQAYNKKYWKIPIVYAALGTAAGFFFYNINTYKDLKQSVIYRSQNDPSLELLIPAKFRHLSTEAMIYYRNSYRRNIDYSVLAFILLWGLNVVDATVDAQLKNFDVSPNLSMRLKPHFSPETNTTGLSLVFDLHSKTTRFSLP